MNTGLGQWRTEESMGGGLNHHSNTTQMTKPISQKPLFQMVPVKEVCSHHTWKKILFGSTRVNITCLVLEMKK